MIYLLIIFILTALNKKPKNRKKMYNEVLMALNNAGLKNPLLFLAQIAHETGNLNFNSAVSLANNNFSGIKFVGQKNATKGTGVKEFGKVSNYAKFATIQDWANNYVSILNRMKATNATTPDELATVLKEGRYYEDTVENYSRGLNYFYSQLKNKV